MRLHIIVWQQKLFGETRICRHVEIHFSDISIYFRVDSSVELVASALKNWSGAGIGNGVRAGAMQCEQCYTPYTRNKAKAHR